MNVSKVAIFYHYFEANQFYKDNFIYFLSEAFNDACDFYIIISSECTVDLPQKTNINYIYAENKNNDFGGYIAAISQLTDIDAYDAYLFINSSVRGPFIPSIYPSNWVSFFTSKLTGDVHLVGSTINILPSASFIAAAFKEQFDYEEPYSHVQTTTYALSRVALKHLLKIGFYDVSERLDKLDVIVRYELRLTQEIKRNGWNIQCFLPTYNSIDYRLWHEDMNFSATNGDPLYSGAYYSRTAHPMELVFVKTNRNMISETDLASFTYTSLAQSNELLGDWNERNLLSERSLQTIKNAFARNQALDEPTFLQRQIGYCRKKIKHFFN